MSAIIKCAESGQLENVAAGYTPELTGLIATQDVLTTQRSFSYDDFSRRISEADGLSRSWQYRYDANNNLTTATDPLNQTTTWFSGYTHFADRPCAAYHSGELDPGRADCKCMGS